MCVRYSVLRTFILSSGAAVLASSVRGLSAKLTGGVPLLMVGKATHRSGIGLTQIVVYVLDQGLSGYLLLIVSVPGVGFF